MTSRDGAAVRNRCRSGRFIPLARRSDRLEQLTAVADRGDAEVLEVLSRQTRQHSAIDVVVAEYRFVLSEPAPARPPRDIHAQQCDPP